MTAIPDSIKFEVERLENVNKEMRPSFLRGYFESTIKSAAICLDYDNIAGALEAMEAAKRFMEADEFLKRDPFLNGDLDYTR